MDTAHAVQNVFLQPTSLVFSNVTVVPFRPEVLGASALPNAWKDLYFERP